jgi:hypothetical protein
MWKSVCGMLLALCICASSFGQCPGGGTCPRTQQPPSIDIGDLPPVDQPSGRYGPTEQEGHLLSVVRVIGIESAGALLKGTGTYVNYEGLYCVVTASHVVRGTQKLYVIFRGPSAAKTVQGVVLSNDPTNDCAVIGLYQHPENGETIAASIAYAEEIANIKNETLRNYGYGGDDVFCGGSGRIVGEFGPSVGMPKSWYSISSSARLGDSGGPIFSPINKLVGVLWGRDDSTIAVVKCNYIHAQLQAAKAKVGVETAQAVQPRPLPRKPKALVPVLPIKPPILPWRDKIENEIDGIKRAPPVKPSPPVVVPSPPTVVPTPPGVEGETPIVDTNRYRVKTVIAVPVILAIVLSCLVIGITVQWRKTYSIQ